MVEDTREITITVDESMYSLISMVAISMGSTVDELVKGLTEAGAITYMVNNSLVFLDQIPPELKEVTFDS